MNDRINRDRAAKNPGGMQCEKCDEIFIGEEWHVLCGVCVKLRDPSQPRDHVGKPREQTTDLMANLKFKTQAEMLDEIIVLRSALMLIARKKKMDAVAAVSMRAIARAAVTPAICESNQSLTDVPNSSGIRNSE